MINRPKILINVFIFNSQGNKLLLGKRYDDGHFTTINGKLDYGEGFEDCAYRILSSLANILLEDQDRLKFLCTYNVVDKESNLHFVSIDYQLELSKEDEKSYLMIDSYHFQTWSWFSFEEVLKMEDILSSGLKVFLKKFSINSLEGIKSLISN
jgi:ADP-ribose pyrophosphatase YjhB (NUDIX family)